MHIEPFSAELVERCLDRRELKFFRGRDGEDFLILISSDRSRLHAHLEVCGPNGDLLSIRVTLVDHYNGAEHHRLIELVNEWNRNTRWPKAYVRETPDPNRIGVVGENSYPLMEGIHLEALGRFIDYTIRGSFELFDRIAEAIELPSAKTLETWLREAG
jgi:hypothetical protein